MEVEGEEKEGLYGITRERSTYKIVPADLTGNSSLHFYHVRSTGKSQPTAKKTCQYAVQTNIIAIRVAPLFEILARKWKEGQAT